MSKVNFKKFRQVLLYIIIFVLAFVLGWVSRSNFEINKVAELASFQNDEEALVKSKVSSLPDVKTFLEKGSDRYVWIEDVSDNLITIHVYEYLGDRTTKTFGRYVYNRSTQEITQVF